MRYGILSKDDWDPEVEGHPDNTRVVVLLNNDGTIALDELYFKTSGGHEVGTGIVYELATAESLAYVFIPLNARVYGSYSTEAEALHVAREQYHTDADAIEYEVNREIERNIMIDGYVDEDKHYRRFLFWLIVAALLGILVMYLAAYRYRMNQGIYEELPFGVHSALISGVWATLSTSIWYA